MKIRHIATILLALLLAHTSVFADNGKIIKGFSGGMMVHSGYLSGCDNPYGYDASGATFGIGGVAKLHLTKHFRAGFDGYFSNMKLTRDIKDGLNRPMGPRIYFGFIFSH